MRLLIALVCIGSMLASCSENNNDLKSDLNEALESVAADASKYEGRLDELLTLEMASECSGLAASEAEVEYNKLMTNPEYHSLAYTWKSDRKRELNVSGMKMEVPMPNLVQISWVKESDLKKFTFSYHNPTKEELANAQKAMKAKEEEMVRDGKISSEQAGMADGMANEMIANYTVINVPNLGDKAVWIQTKQDNHLKVLYNGIEFQLTIELSDIESENKAKAIGLARKVINNM